MLRASRPTAREAAGWAFPPWASPLAFVIVLGANRTITPRTPFLLRAVVDEAAHLATTTLLLRAVGSEEPQFVASALASSVLIDTDHLPDALFGPTSMTSNASRPCTHSLPTIAVALALSRRASPARRPPLDGVVFGLASHFLRDITEGSGGAPLFWPLRKRAVRLPGRLQTPMILALLLYGSLGRSPT